MGEWPVTAVLSFGLPVVELLLTGPPNVHPEVAVEQVMYAVCCHGYRRNPYLVKAISLEPKLPVSHRDIFHFLFALIWISGTSSDAPAHRPVPSRVPISLASLSTVASLWYILVSP